MSDALAVLRAKLLLARQPDGLARARLQRGGMSDAHPGWRLANALPSDVAETDAKLCQDFFRAQTPPTIWKQPAGDEASSPASSNGSPWPAACSDDGGTVAAAVAAEAAAAPPVPRWKGPVPPMPAAAPEAALASVPPSSAAFVPARRHRWPGCVASARGRPLHEYKPPGSSALSPGRVLLSVVLVASAVLAASRAERALPGSLASLLGLVVAVAIAARAGGDEREGEWLGPALGHVDEAAALAELVCSARVGPGKRSCRQLPDIAGSV